MRLAFSPVVPEQRAPFMRVWSLTTNYVQNQLLHTNTSEKELAKLCLEYTKKELAAGRNLTDIRFVYTPHYTASPKQCMQPRPQ